MNSSPILLARKGSLVHDNDREQKVYYLPPGSSILVPDILSREPYVLLKGELAEPEDFDGKPLTARLKENGETVHIVPELRINSISGDPDHTQRLLTLLHGRYLEQIPAIRDRIDGIFRSHLGMNPSAEQLEQIATSDMAGSANIRSDIYHQLGLNVSWLLQPEPVLANWLQRVVRETPKYHTLSFNGELPQTEFRLSFTLKIERGNLSHIGRLQRRAARGLTPAQEVDEVFEAIRLIAKPAFSISLMGTNIWNVDLVRDFARDGFSTIVARRIASDYGYQIEFSNFAPELNQQRLEDLKGIDSRGMTRDMVLAKQKLILDLDRKRNALLLEQGHTPEVEELATSIAAVKQELTDAGQAHLEAGDQSVQHLRYASGAEVEELREKFRQALRLQDDEGDRRYAPPPGH